MRVIGLLLILLSLASWCQAQQRAAELLNRAHVQQKTAQYKQALVSLQQAADFGLAQAQYELGAAYHAGEGTDRNDLEAVRWLKKAAQQQYLPAQRMLGTEHWPTGIVGERQKVAYLEAGATANDLLSLVYLSHKYDSVYHQQAQAPMPSQVLQLKAQIATLPQAASRDDSSTVFQEAYRLGVVYQSGQRLPLDVVESYKWYLLMNEMYTLSVRLLWSEAFSNYIRPLHDQLTPAQRALALSRAEAAGHRKLKRLHQFDQALSRFPYRKNQGQPDEDDWGR